MYRSSEKVRCNDLPQPTITKNYLLLRSNTVTYSIIIPYHSNRSLLYTCISSIITTISDDTEIIIVENNDDANQLDIKVPDRCQVLRYNENLYYPKAINIGAKAAHGDFVVLVDADIFVQNGWLEALTNCFLSNPSVGGCSAKMLDPFDGSIKEFGIGYNGYNFPHPFAGRPASFQLTTQDCEVQAFCSATSIFRRDLFLEIGGLDERLVDGYSDIEFCIRLHKNGYRTYVVANALVYHHGSSTIDSGMSFHLHADTKGVFMAYHGLNCIVDMDKYFQHSFESFANQKQHDYYLIDLTTVANKRWHYDLFEKVGNIVCSGIYNRPFSQRNAKHIPLYTLIDDNLRRLCHPICYFVDDYRALRNNKIWDELRDCSLDIIIDRNANLLSFSDANLC